MTTFVFAHKTPRLRDSFLKGSTSQEHDGNDISTFLLTFPLFPSPFFDRVQRPTPVSSVIDQHRSANVRSAVMWQRLASGQSRFRRQMSIQPRGSKPVYALLSFLCFPFISRYSLRAANWKSVTNTRVYWGRRAEGVA